MTKLHLLTSKYVFLLYYIAAFPLGRAVVEAQSRFEGIGNCSEPCVPNEEFCATNNTCIRYSCQNWYLFGPPEYTGHDSGTPILIYGPDTSTGKQSEILFVPDLNFTSSAEPASLECQFNAKDLHSTGIIYGCSGWSCGGDGCTGYDTYSYGNLGIDQEYTRRCEATNGKNRYVCFDLGVGEFFTDFQSFRNLAETFEINCTMNYDPNTTDSTDPKFIYQVTLGSPGTVVLAGPSSNTFNDSLVDIAMHSYVEEVVASGSTSGGNPLFSMLGGLWTIAATTMIGVFVSECLF